jgi:hypothetical protein
MKTVEEAALHGWAFDPEAGFLSEAIGLRYAELAKLEGFVITQAYDPSDYNCTTYRGTAPESFSNGDIAILCDRGNCCFGAHVERSGDTFKCRVSTD